MNIDRYEVLSGSQAKPYKTVDQIILGVGGEVLAAPGELWAWRATPNLSGSQDFSRGELTPDGSIPRFGNGTCPLNKNIVGLVESARRYAQAPQRDERVAPPVSEPGISGD